MPNKFVALNDFFHPVQHLFHSLLLIKNIFAAKILISLTKQTKQMKQKRFILALASVSKRRVLSFLMLAFCTMMYAQQEISGTVVDAMGPVIGATVM